MIGHLPLVLAIAFAAREVAPVEFRLEIARATEGAASGGERSLDDFLRALVREARARPDGVLDIEREDLFTRLEAWIDAGTLADVRASAVSGAPFELPPDTFAPVLAIEDERGAGGVVQRARLLESDPERCRASLGGAGLRLPMRQRVRRGLRAAATSADTGRAPCA